MTTHLLRTLVFIALVAALPAVGRGQQPPPQKPPAAAPVEAPKPTPASTAQSPSTGQPLAAPAGYAYKPDGRRDPFVSLLGRATDARSATNRPTGLAGFLINEVIVTGIIKGGAGYVATLRGPDNKSYIVRTGERLMDGTVKSISERQVVFSQDVTDPLSLIKQREIPKSVRPGGESME